MHAARRLRAEATAPDIYTYDDYRSYLRDRLQFLINHLGQSTRQVAKQAGVSESYLSMVVSGQRRLSEDQLRKLAPALTLERGEASYLEWLIAIVDASTPEDQMLALRKIQRFRRYRNLNPLEIEAYRYLEHWYHVAIREMAQLDEFREDPKWIQDMLVYKVGLPEIKHAVAFLVDHGFLVRDADSRFSKPEKQIHCQTGVLNAALTRFHTQMLDLASQSLTETPSAERNISAFTCAVKPSQVDAAKTILEEARQKIIALTKDNKDTGAIYHFRFLAFPLTKKPGAQE